MRIKKEGIFLYNLRYLVLLVLVFRAPGIVSAGDDTDDNYEVEVEPLPSTDLHQYNDPPQQENTWIQPLSPAEKVKDRESELPDSPPGKNEGCHNALDLCLVMDSSYSISQDGWRTAIVAAKQLVDGLDIAPNGVHVSVMKFSTDVQTYYMFNSDADKPQLKRLIDRMEYEGEFSRTDMAVKEAKEVFSRASGARDNVPKVFLLLGDGRLDGSTTGRTVPINWNAALIGPLEELREQNVTIFCVAIGASPLYNQLNWIAGDRSRVFSQDALSIRSLLESLRNMGKTICPKIIPPYPIRPTRPTESVCTSTPPSCTPTETCYPKVPTCIMIPPRQPCTPITTTCEKTNSITTTKTLPPVYCTVTTTSLSTCTPTQTCYPATCLMVQQSTPCNATTTTCYRTRNVTTTNFVRPTVTCTATTTKMITCTPSPSCYPPNMNSCVNLIMMPMCQTVTSTLTSCPSTQTAQQTATETPSPSPSSSPSPTLTPSASVTPLSSSDVTPTPSPTQALASTTTVTVTVTVTLSVLPPAAPATPQADPADTGTSTLTATVTQTETVTPTEAISPSSTVSPPESVSPSATVSPSESVSPSASASPSESVSPSDTASPSESVSPSDTASPSESVSPSDTASPTESASPLDTASPSESVSPSDTASPSESATPTQSPTGTPSPSETVSPTQTASPTAQTSETPQLSESPTPTVSSSPALSSAYDSSHEIWIVTVTVTVTKTVIVTVTGYPQATPGAAGDFVRRSHRSRREQFTSSPKNPNSFKQYLPRFLQKWMGVD